VRGDPAALASGLARRLDGPGPAGHAWVDGWLGAAAAVESALGSELARLERPTEPGVHAALGAIYSNGDQVYTASSMPIRDQETFLPAGAARVRFLCNRGANGIDGLISSAAGAAASSGRPTWVLVGDLGLVHDMNGLAALREVDTPVRVVVLNNGGGGIFEFLPQAEAMDRDEFEALLGTPSGLEIERIAALHGLRYERVERLDDLAAPTDAPVILEVEVDRAENHALHRRLTEIATTAIAGTPKQP
jgi:2-succinyl-5-enolpyruvyl-6-hydroxy-3-cyclohexene-1-carboxylate synthase